jgi:hypothetical protein
MSIIMKYAGEFMHLGDQAQYFDERLKKMHDVLNLVEINTVGLSFFASRIQDEEAPKDLYERLDRQLTNIVRVREKLIHQYKDIAEEMGLFGRLSQLQSAIEDAKFQVRREIHH